MLSIIKNGIKKNWKEILLTVSAPLIAYVFNSFIKFVFKIGILFGTFLKSLEICIHLN